MPPESIHSFSFSQTKDLAFDNGSWALGQRVKVGGMSPDSSIRYSRGFCSLGIVAGTNEKRGSYFG